MNGLLMKYFGGVSTKDPAGIYAYVLVMEDLIRWLLPIAVCLLLVGARLERRRGIEILAGCRYSTAGRWWRSRFWDSQRFGMKAGIAMLTAAAAFDAVMAAVSAGAAAVSGTAGAFDATAASVPIAEVVPGMGGAAFDAAAASVPVGAAAVSGVSAAAGLSALLWLVHMTVILSLLLLLDLTVFRRFAAGALLLLEGLSFLEGVADRRLAPFMWGMWGMYRQSSWYDSRFGISSGTALLLEGGLLLFFYLTGSVRQKRAGEKR